MAESNEFTIRGKKFTLASKDMLPAGKRAWQRDQRPSQPSDPGVPQMARWLLSAPQGNSREDVSQGAGVLSVDWTSGIDTLYDALAIPGPKVYPIALVAISQSEFVETSELAVTESDGDSAASDDAVGTIAWANPSNVLVDDTAVTTATGTGQTEYLKVLLGAATRLPSGATLQGFKMTFRRYATPGPAWTVIGSTTLASPASSISFATGLSGYTMFRITAYIVKDGTLGAIQMRINNDSGANYDDQTLSGNSTAVGAARQTGQTQWPFPQSAVAASTNATLEVTISKSVSTSPALAVASFTFIPNGESSVGEGRSAGRWNNTADLISRIDLISSSGNFAAGTVALLEGVPDA